MLLTLTIFAGVDRAAAAEGAVTEGHEHSRDAGVRRPVAGDGLTTYSGASKRWSKQPLAHARSPRDNHGTRSAMEGIVSSANLERIPVLGLQPS